MKSPRHHERSFALVITLCVLAIVSILLVGFVVSMKTEKLAAGATVNDQRSKIIAQIALEHAIALLENNIPDPVGPGQVNPNNPPESWTISPGLLTKIAGPNGTAPIYIPLSTATNASLTSQPNGDVVNLNAKQLSTGNYPIIGTGQPVPMNWVYITQDPTSPPSASNPIIGRYAFWMDDENAKININTAYGKPAYASLNFNRSNPLDQSVDNHFQWLGSAGDYFNTNVGFDSLVGGSFSYLSTNNGTTVTSYGNEDIFPMSVAVAANGTPAYTNRAVMANAVGNVTLPSPTPAATDLRRYYPLWHPSAVNIAILPASTNSGAASIGTGLDINSMADWVYNLQYNSAVSSTQNWRLFQDPSQIQEFVTNGSSTNFYQANKFNLTAYNRAPEFNAFDKPRLFMESRIEGMTDPLSSGQDTSRGNLSGNEQIFYNTPDMDPQGPMYFHGFENMTPYTGGNAYFPDLTGVQMVGDYLSGMMANTNWPGMPAVSFATKWSQSPFTTTQGNLEADQVAWNIVSLGNYASNEEGDNGGPACWPDDYYLDFLRSVNQPLYDPAGDYSPYLVNVSGQSALFTNSSTPAAPDPDRVLRVGKLSGKAIMPFSPKPYLNEVALQVTAIPVPNQLPTTNLFYLKLSMIVELYVPLRGPPGTFRSHLTTINFGCTHLFAAVTQNNSLGKAVGVTMGATASTYGNGGSSEAYTNTAGALTNYGTTYQGKNEAGSANAPWVRPFTGAFPTVPGYATNVSSSVANFLPVNSYPEISTTDGRSIMVPSTNYEAGVNATTMLYDNTTNGAPNLALPSTSYFPFNGSSTNGSTVANIQANARLFLFGGAGLNSDRTYEICPVWDQVDNSTTALAPPAGQSDSLTWNFNIDLSQASTTTYTTYTHSVELPDSRLGGNSLAWKTHPNNSTTQPDANLNPSTQANTLGTENQAQITDQFDPNSYSFWDFQSYLSTSGVTLTGGFYENSSRPSIGFLSSIPNGMQRGIVNSTLIFGPTGASTGTATPLTTVSGSSVSTPNPSGQLPDWLLLDLLAPSFQDPFQPSFAPYSYLHSTMGKINLNANIYPTIQDTSGNTLQRWLPLQALFANMDSGDAAGSITPSSATPSSTIVANIMNHKLSGQAYGAMSGSYPQYDYAGELCEVAGVADGANTPGSTSGNSWQQAALIRTLANLVTTQSNTFHVWGAAQSIQIVKGPGNTTAGVYQPGDIVVVNGEKRFESVVERAVWPGIDGVPGNGHVNSSGLYDRNSTNTTTPFPTAAFPWAAVSVSSAASSSAVLPNNAKWAGFDGPLSPATPRNSAGYTPAPGWYNTLNYTNSLLINANNPAQAHMYYKPLLFRYITE